MAGSQMKLGLVVDTDTRATQQEFRALRTEVKTQAEKMGTDWETAAGRVEDALREAGARDDLIQAARKIGREGPTEIEKMRSSLRDVGDAGRTAADDIQTALNNIDVSLGAEKFDNFKSEIRANAVESGSEIVQGLADGIDQSDMDNLAQGVGDILFQTGAAVGGPGGAAMMAGSAIGLALYGEINKHAEDVKAVAEDVFEAMKEAGVQSFNALDAESRETFLNMRAEALLTEHGIDSITEAASTLGLQTGTVLAAMAGDTEAVTKVQDAYNNKVKDLHEEYGYGTEVFSSYYDDLSSNIRVVTDETGAFTEGVSKGEQMMRTLAGASREFETEASGSFRGVKAGYDALTDSLKVPLSPTVRPNLDMSGVDKAIRSYRPPVVKVSATLSTRLGVAVY